MRRKNSKNMKSGKFWVTTEEDISIINVNYWIRFLNKNIWANIYNLIWFGEESESSFCSNKDNGELFSYWDIWKLFKSLIFEKYYFICVCVLFIFNYTFSASLKEINRVITKKRALNHFLTDFAKIVVALFLKWAFTLEYDTSSWLDRPGGNQKIEIVREVGLQSGIFFRKITF